MTLNICKGKHPPICLKASRVEAKVWYDLEFYKHHYLTSNLNTSAICLLFTWENNPVAFVALLNAPGKDHPYDMSVSRLVILPEYQGLGLTSKILNFCGGIITNKYEGARLCIKTIHEKVGQFLEHSPNWRPSCTNLKFRKDLEGKKFHLRKGFSRASFCYIYCGNAIKGYEDLVQPIHNAREQKQGVQSLFE